MTRSADKLLRTAAAVFLTLPAALPAGGQVINDWSNSNGIVTTVDEGAVKEGEYDAQGILSEWSEILEDFEKDKGRGEEIDMEIKTLRAGGGEGLNVFYGADGRRYELPRILSPEGIDLFLLTPEGMTIYMAFDAPVYLQDIDDDILRWVRFYAYTRRYYTSKVFARYKEWEPRIKAYFASIGVPEELAEICLIESGCTYGALSSAGALGMWQIMPDTGRSHGMRIDAQVDERLDPVASTLAAGKILLSKYRQTGDWTLAAAAYNCGAGRFQGQRKGLPWSSVKRYLPKETQQYIPGLIAMHYVWTYRRQLGFDE